MAVNRDGHSPWQAPRNPTCRERDTSIIPSLQVQGGRQGGPSVAGGIRSFALGLSLKKRAEMIDLAVCGRRGGFVFDLAVYLVFNLRSMRRTPA